MLPWQSGKPACFSHFGGVCAERITLFPEAVPPAKERAKAAALRQRFLKAKCRY
jgi:hypothetical protein